MKFSVNQLLCFLMICICLSLASCVDKSKKEEPATIADPIWTELMELSGSVRPEKRWDHEDLNAFLLRIPLIQRRFLFMALDKHEEANKVAENTAISDTDAVQKELLWQSSSWITYKFKDRKTIPYHSLVCWVAEDIGIDRSITTCESTFILERMIFLKLYGESWDKMSVSQREYVIEGTYEDKSEVKKIALLSGAALFATMAVSKNAMGFAFFTGLSQIIHRTAEILRLVLPFAVYSMASSVTAIALSPIGITVASICTFLAVANIGSASVKKTTQVIMQLHAVKVASLEAAGLPIPECPKYFLKSL